MPINLANSSPSYQDLAAPIYQGKLASPAAFHSTVVYSRSTSRSFCWPADQSQINRNYGGAEPLEVLRFRSRRSRSRQQGCSPPDPVTRKRHRVSEAAPFISQLLSLYRLQQQVEQLCMNSGWGEKGGKKKVPTLTTPAALTAITTAAFSSESAGWHFCWHQIWSDALGAFADFLNFPLQSVCTQWHFFSLRSSNKPTERPGREAVESLQLTLVQASSL